MGIPALPPGQPSTSALQAFINSNTNRRNQDGTQTHLHQLALQIAHNLRYQHYWTDIRIHFRASSLPRPPGPSSSPNPLPRPLLSGIPPKRLYVHPDEQIELLQQQKRDGKTGMPELTREQEWVLPSHLREKWSLRRIGSVFDGISWVPEEGEALFGDGVGWGEDGEDDHGVDPEAADEIDEDGGNNSSDNQPNVWRTSQPKRLLLATLDDDSTITYYIVHDGIVKPRQN